MCGLTGYSGKKPVDLTKIRMLLLANRSRGTDSTGVAGNQRYRAVESADTFIQQQGFESALRNAKTVIGHTRKQSSGAIDKESAHPFRVGVGNDALYGAHNGTIRPYDLRKASEYFDIPFENTVDSHFIFTCLYENRDKKGNLQFDKVLPYIDGSMALSIKYKNSLYLYRRDAHHSRPLYTAFNDGEMYYSSIEDSLKYLGHSYSTNVTELSPDAVIEIKNGKIIDTIPVRKVLRNSAGFNKETGEPNTPPKSAYTPTNLQKQTKKQDTSPKQTLFLGSGDKINSHVQTEDLKRWNEVIDNTITSFDRIDSDFSDVDSFDSSYDEGYVVINLTTSYLQDKIPLESFIVWLEHPDNPKDRLWCITLPDGMGAIQVPLKWFKGGNIYTRICASDPLWGNEFFAGKVSIESGRVLEVALNIPFRYVENSLKLPTWYGNDEAYFSAISRAQQNSKIPDKKGTKASSTSDELRSSVSDDCSENVGNDGMGVQKLCGTHKKQNLRQFRDYILDAKIRRKLYSIYKSGTLADMKPYSPSDYIRYQYQIAIEKIAEKEYSSYNYSGPEEYVEDALSWAVEDDCIDTIVKDTLRELFLPESLQDELDLNKMFEDAAIFHQLLGCSQEEFTFTHFITALFTIKDISLEMYKLKDVLPFDGGTFEDYSLIDDSDDYDYPSDEDYTKYSLYWVITDYKESEIDVNVNSFLLNIINPIIDGIDRLKGYEMSKSKLNIVDDLSSYIYQLDYDTRQFLPNSIVNLKYKRNIDVQEEVRAITEMVSLSHKLFTNVKDPEVLYNVRKISENLSKIKKAFEAHRFIVQTQ